VNGGDITNRRMLEIIPVRASPNVIRIIKLRMGYTARRRAGL
jgi:hypothetical protein